MSHTPSTVPEPLEPTPMEYGGALDGRSGGVFIPPGADLPPCRFPCARYRAKGKQ